MNVMKHLVVAAAVCGSVIAAPVWAREGKPINETRPLAADGALSINNVAGSITVTGWDRPEVAISGTLGESVENLEISGDGKKLSVYVRYPRNRDSGDTHLELRVPARAQLQLDAVSADITVATTSGPISAKSVSGDVQLNVGSGEINASTVSGDLTVKAPSFKTTLNSVSGDLRASGVRGVLKAETVSGQLSVQGGTFSELTLQSVSGDMDLDLALDDVAKVGAETLSGDIELHLPKAPNAQLTMKTYSGDISNGFANDRGDSEVRKVSTTLGAGRGSIDLHTFSGDITVTPKR